MPQIQAGHPKAVPSLVKILSLALALAVTSGAIALRAPNDSQGQEAFDQSQGDVEASIRQYASSLQGDPANPYRWSDLGSAFVVAQQMPEARFCYTRALELSGEIPQIWLRDANFHIQAGDIETALHSAGRVLRTVPDYDLVLFGYFDRLGVGTDSILSEIGNDKRATVSYAQYLLDNKKVDQAVEVWRDAESKGFADDRLAALYIDVMLSSRRYAEAWHDWIAYLDGRRGGYPDNNLFFNAGFENVPTGSAFDWRIRPSGEFETAIDASAAHEGTHALRIRFHGISNVSYDNVIQEVHVASGNYTFDAWIRTDDITTNEGPRIELFDPESATGLRYSTDSFLGTVPWKLVRQVVAVPVGENLLGVRVVRHVSQKIDSKINGDFWMDSVRLVRQ